MRPQTLPGLRWISTMALAGAATLAMATACGSSDTFASGGPASGGSGAAAGGSGGSTGGTGTGGSGTGGSGGSGTAGGAGTGTGGTAGTGGTSTCGICDGCCVGSSCVPAAKVSWTQCGAHGSTCTSCAYGVRCDGGGCTDKLDPAALFHIVVDSVELQPTKASGGTWDLTGLPDPMVCFDDGNGTDGCTNYCSEQLSCTYSTGNGTVAKSGTPVDFSGESLSHVKMLVYDYDSTNPDDPAGSKALNLQTYSTQYSYHLFDQVVSVSFQLVHN